MIDFIWSDILVNPMTNALVVLSNVFFDNFGLGIIVFTIFIRAVTYPLTLRQLRSTRALQELQKKYKDPKRRQEEMMKLYREVGFNPLGCALPFVVQIPVWIALFQVIRATVGTSPEALLKLSDRLYGWSFINEAVPLNSQFLFLDLGSSSIPLALMVGVATFYQQKFSPRAPSSDERSASMTRTMLWMMPLLFGWFTLTVPSGLGLYWLVTSFFSILTTYLYNGRPRLYRRWFISMDSLPIVPRDSSSAQMPVVTSGATSSSGDNGAAAEADSGASDSTKPEPRRRRRRRRRRAPARTGPEGTSHDASET